MIGRNILLKQSCTIFILWWSHFFVDFMLAIWPIFKTIAHLDLALAGLIAGFGAFLGEGFQLFSGSLSDRGYRKALIILGIVFACLNTLLPYTQNYFLLFMLYLFTCIGSGAFHPSAAGLIGSLSENNKALLMTIFASGGYIGFACSQWGFIQAMSWLNGHTILLIFFPLALVAFALLYPLQSNHDSTSKKLSKVDVRDCFRLFRNRDLTYLYLVQLCNASIMWGMVFLLPDLLLSRGYEPWICFGGGHFWCILGAGIMIIPAGYLADKISAKSVILVATILGALCYYFLLANPTLKTSVLLPLLFSIGALISLVNPISLALGNRIMPNNPGLISAFLMGLVWCVAECIGPGGGGILTKLFTEDAAARALTILGIFFIGTFIAAWNLPDIVSRYSLDPNTLQIEV